MFFFFNLERSYPFLIVDPTGHGFCTAGSTISMMWIPLQWDPIFWIQLCRSHYEKWIPLSGFHYEMWSLDPTEWHYPLSGWAVDPTMRNWEVDPTNYNENWILLGIHWADPTMINKSLSGSHYYEKWIIPLCGSYWIKTMRRWVDGAIYPIKRIGFIGHSLNGSHYKK